MHGYTRGCFYQQATTQGCQTLHVAMKCLRLKYQLECAQVVVGKGGERGERGREKREREKREKLLVMPECQEMHVYDSINSHITQTAKKAKVDAKTKH